MTSQRYGVISVVISIPLTQKHVHALSSMYRRKLNKMGDDWSPNNNVVHFVTPLFSSEVGPFPNVMELFQWLFQSH